MSEIYRSICKKIVKCISIFCVYTKIGTHTSIKKDEILQAWKLFHVKKSLENVKKEKH